jgi:hypothetical protein
LNDKHHKKIADDHAPIARQLDFSAVDFEGKFARSDLGKVSTTIAAD